MSEGQVGNEGVIDWSTGGQSDKFYTTGRQSANGPNLRWIYCNYPKTKNYCLKTFVEIRVGEKVCENGWNIV